MPTYSEASDWAARGRRERSGISSFISDLGDLKVGDYVVHIDHGIGIYQGLRQIAVTGGARDFMLLTFQDEPGSMYRLSGWIWWRNTAPRRRQTSP